MAIYRTDVANMLAYGVKTNFLKGMTDYMPLRTAFTRETTSTGKSETYADVATVPMPSETVGMPIVHGAHDVTISVTNKHYDITIAITHDAINDNRVGGLEEWARQAGLNYERHKDKLCFQALNAGDTSTYGLCYDGQNYFSNSHTDAGAEYTTAQDNLNGSTLSLDNFETIEVAAANFLNDRGEPTGYNYDLIVTAPALKRTAAQITDNEEAYDTANREMNPYVGTKYLVSPYMDSTAWVLVASGEVMKPIILQIRQAPKLVMWDDNMTDEGGIRYFKFDARYYVGYGDWRLSNMGNT